MERAILLQEISDKNVDVDKFVNLIIDDELLREEIVKQLLTNPKIMVYYHCYYIVSKASELKPVLFYEYWAEFAALLNHENSYHRDIGLTILANLSAVDDNNLLNKIFPDYVRHLNDKKFMTAQCCLKNFAKILKHKNKLREEIIELLLDIEKRTDYPEKQLELLKYGVLELFEQVYFEVQDTKRIDSFIKTAVNSISPKTKKKAKQLKKKFDL